MMGQQSRTESLFYYFRLEEQIPTDHLLRMIDSHVDFSFVREELKDFYSPTGRPSIDPEVLLRLLLVGYLYGITSERRLMEEVRMHLAYRWFTRLGFEQELPEHSTFSKNRHGRFRQSGVFRKVFEKIVRCCLEAGFVDGRNVAVDGTLVGANASQLTNGSGVSDRTRAREPRGRFRKEREASREGVDDRSRCYLGNQKWAGGAGLLRQLSGRHDEPSYFGGPCDAGPVQSRNVGCSAYA
jgi:transposase